MSFMGGKSARRNYGKTRAAIASVAAERFQILLDQAKTMALTSEKLSRRYVSLARKISSRTKVRIPRESKMYLCKGCGIALVPGHNAKIRLHARTTGIVISCLSCGAVKRYPVKPKTAVTASARNGLGNQVVKVEASARQYAPGEAINREVDILLEDHPLKTPVRAKLVGFIEDLDRNRRGWYLASLKSPTPILGDPVTQALIFARGGWDIPVPGRPAYDGEGRQISYYYDNPIEEMLLNSKSSIKYVVSQVATIKDPALLKAMRLTDNQISIYPFATIWRPSN